VLLLLDGGGHGMAHAPGRVAHPRNQHRKLDVIAQPMRIPITCHHGAVRHLFATYVEDGGSTRIKNGALLADSYLLFIEGCLFVMIASVLKETVTFGWVLVTLLLLDCVWGFLAWLAFTGGQAQHAERILRTGS